MNWRPLMFLKLLQFLLNFLLQFLVFLLYYRNHLLLMILLFFFRFLFNFLVRTPNFIDSDARILAVKAVFLEIVSAA